MTLRSTIKRFDSQITSRILTILAGKHWHGFFAFVTRLGDPITIIGITGAIVFVGVYLQNTQLALSGAAIPVVVGIGAIIKLLVERARPINEYSAKLGTFSFPSGHSTGSMVAFGLLAFIAFVTIPDVLGVAAAVVLLLVSIAVGISRVRLGAHYPSDVVAGWLLGMIGLLVIMFVIRPL